MTSRFSGRLALKDVLHSGAEVAAQAPEILDRSVTSPGNAELTQNLNSENDCQRSKTYIAQNVIPCIS